MRFGAVHGALEGQMNLPSDRSRLLQISPILGDDYLLLSLSGVEGFSEPFLFKLTALSNQVSHDLSEYGGQPVRICIDFDGDEPRYIHGVISNTIQGVNHDIQGLYTYEFEVVPYFWKLSAQDSYQRRVFRDKSVVDIAKKIFAEEKLKNYMGIEFRFLTQTYENIPYVVQLDETNLEFINRIFAEAGIFYYFKHDEKMHTIVLGDSLVAYGPMRGKLLLKGNNAGNHARNHARNKARNSVYFWLDKRSQLGANRLSVLGTNKRVQSSPLKSSIDTAAPQPFGLKQEAFCFNGELHTDAEIKRHNRIQLDISRTERERVAAISNYYQLCPADCFQFQAPDQESLHQNSLQEYMTTEIEHKAYDFSGLVADRACLMSLIDMKAFIDLKTCNHEFDDYNSNQSHLSSDYVNKITAIPSTGFCYRVTFISRPIIEGFSEARVVSDMSIDRDNNACVQLQFPWDTDGQFTPLVRVASAQAGDGWGHQWTPQVGDLVTVLYENGDIYRPIVVGSAYDETQPPIFDPKVNPAKTGIKTSAGHELSFDDTANKESIKLYSVGDYDLNAGGTYRIDIGYNYYKSVEQGDHNVCAPNGKVIYEAEEELVFRCGNSKICMRPDCVDIYGDIIHINNPADIAAEGTDVYSVDALGNKVLLHDGAVSLMQGNAEKGASENSDAAANKNKQQQAAQKTKDADEDIFQCIPVKPRWRRLTAKADIEDFSTILRLPEDFRREIYDALIKDYSVSAKLDADLEFLNTYAGKILHNFRGWKKSDLDSSNEILAFSDNNPSYDSGGPAYMEAFMGDPRKYFVHCYKGRCKGFSRSLGLAKNDANRLYDLMLKAYDPKKIFNLDLKSAGSVIDYQKLGMEYEKNYVPLDFSISISFFEQSSIDWLSKLSDINPKLKSKVDAHLKCKVQIDTKLNGGRIYIFYRQKGTEQFYLFAEYQVSAETGWVQPIRLDRYAGLNKRCVDADAEETYFIPLPFKNKQGDIETIVCYSEQPWSWPRIHAMGGMNPNDPRLKDARQNRKAAKLLDKLKSVKTSGRAELVKRRFGCTVATALWINEDRVQDVSKTEAMMDFGLTVKMIFTGGKVTHPEWLESQDEKQLQLDSIVRANNTNVPSLLLEDPIGMACLASSDTKYLWKIFVKFLENLRSKDSASYVGDDLDMQSENYFAAAVMAQQMYFSWEANDASKFESSLLSEVLAGCILSHTSEMDAATIFKGEINVPLTNVPAHKLPPALKAGDLMDQNKCKWALRTTDRTLRKYLIKQLQAINTDLLLQPTEDDRVDINTALKDNFAQGPAEGFLALQDVMGFASQDPDLLDFGMDVDNNYINKTEVKIDSVVYTEYFDIPCGHLKRVTEVVGDESSVKELSVKEKPLPPGIRYLKALQEAMLKSKQSNEWPYIHTSIFPQDYYSSASKRDAKIYFEGQGEFWPAGFWASWNEGHYTKIWDVIDNVSKPTALFQHIITMIIHHSQKTWYKDPANRKTEVRKLYLKLLSHGDPLFKKDNIIFSKSAGKDYKILLLEGKLRPTKKFKRTRFAALDANNTLQIFDHEVDAIKAVHVREKNKTVDIETVKTKLTLTYLKKDFKMKPIWDMVHSTISRIVQCFAIYDVFYTLTELGKKPNDVERWMKAASSGIGATIVAQDLLKDREVTKDSKSPRNLAKDEEEINIIKHLGYAALVIDITCSVWDFKKCLGKGDPYAIASKGLGAIAAVGMGAGKVISKVAPRLGMMNKMGGFGTVDAVADEEIAEAVSSLIPGFDILELLFLSVQVISFILSFFEDNEFETWARRCPFSKKLPSDKTCHMRSPDLLYAKLIDLIFSYRLDSEVVSGSSEKQVCFISHVFPLLGKEASIRLETCWDLELSPLGLADGYIADFRKRFFKLNDEADDILSVPGNQIIGKIAIIKQPLYSEIQHALIDVAKVNSLNLDQFSHCLHRKHFDLELSARAAINAGTLHLPTLSPHQKSKKQKHADFIDESGYYHSKKLRVGETSKLQSQELSQEDIDRLIGSVPSLRD